MSSKSDVELVVFTGGEDVSPELYGHENARSYCNTQRDRIEVAVFEQAKALDIPMAGICRGAQLLCVMAGGKLVQHMTGHGRHHKVRTWDGRSITVSSTHHQMQHPWELADDEWKLLAWSEEPLSSHYIYNGQQIQAVEATEELRREVDCAWYPKIKALAMQYHPEYMDDDSEGFRFSQELVDTFIKPELASVKSTKKLAG